ncbi:ferrochelatase [Blastopirellula marina]|uniref:Ferrochelatase n=1 Tax=Blastopirellula marina TaxID=124 RepID=A0A2S8FTB4_9BACT|nr:ferrochelatase [Blastopirellula marina]PQO35415.1 ferrochelatase [Blastopirellula marina]PTL44055.1 ferrochelatase [Blastopirellula marina]
MKYDALLVQSFGGPEGPDEVIPFLENVLRGRNVPRERLLEVAEHYQHFGGVSPINQQNRDLIAALKVELQTHGIDLPVYWGNRNWTPYLADTLAQMEADGVQHALVFVTSVFSSYSGCRQYREDVAKAQAEIGPGAPRCDKIRTYYNHPGFIETMTACVQESLDQIPAERRAAAELVFTAHSIPIGMSDNCNYVKQLNESCRLVSEATGHANWRLVYQSRSGPPTQPWLEPDVCDVIRELAASGAKDVIVSPIGFISDHMEVLFDLDTEAKDTAAEVGLNFIRSGTAGVRPRFIQMIRELIEERLNPETPKLALGTFGPSHDFCPSDCCLYAPQRPRPG